MNKKDEFNLESYICPLKHGKECEGDFCSWWFKPESCCVIISIASSLYNISKSRTVKSEMDNKNNNKYSGN